MNGQERRAKLEQAKCNTVMGISCILTEKGVEKGLQVIKYLRTKLAEEAKSMPGINHLTTYVINGKWFLTGDGNIHEIVSPSPEFLPKGKYVMTTETFLKFAGINAFSGVPIA